MNDDKQAETYDDFLNNLDEGLEELNIPDEPIPQWEKRFDLRVYRFSPTDAEQAAMMLALGRAMQVGWEKEKTAKCKYCKDRGAVMMRWRDRVVKVVEEPTGFVKGGRRRKKISDEEETPLYVSRVFSGFIPCICKAGFALKKNTKRWGIGVFISESFKGSVFCCGTEMTVGKNMRQCNNIIRVKSIDDLYIRHGTVLCADCYNSCEGFDDTLNDLEEKLRGMPGYKPKNNTSMVSSSPSSNIETMLVPHKLTVDEMLALAEEN